MEVGISYVYTVSVTCTVTVYREPTYSTHVATYIYSCCLTVGPQMAHGEVAVS